MLISASPIVDTPLSPRVQQPDIQKVYRINKKLRICSSLIRRVSTNQPAVLVCSLKCCLCVNHPENNTIRSHFCQSFNFIQIFSVLFKVVIWMKVRSHSAKLFLLPIKIQSDSSPSTLEVSKGSCKIPVHQKTSSVQPVLRVSEKDPMPFSRQIWPITCLSPFNNRAHVPRRQFLIQRCNELFKTSLGDAACVPSDKLQQRIAGRSVLSQGRG